MVPRAPVAGVAVDAGGGVTLALLWEEYRGAHSDGFGYSWFCEQYGAFKSRLRPPMRQSHAAGEKVFVDFAGDAIEAAGRYAAVAAALSTEGFGAVEPIPTAARVRAALSLDAPA